MSNDASDDGHAPASHADDGAVPPGSVVGGFVVERRIGKGGAGTVYLAADPAIGKRVAIKVLEHTAGDRIARGRFEREARAANDVHHPGIVEVFAIGALADGRPYLVMPFLEGRSLRSELEARGRLGLDEAWSLAREIADALAAAHARGIVHRDVKPDNVFLERFQSRAPVPRLLDFGLAKVAATESDVPMNLTQSGAPVGTPPYMAPEQWWGQAVDARADQYAFGALLFEMIAGRPPFDAPRIAELVQQHLHALPPKLGTVGVEAPRAFEAALLRMLAKDAAARFPTMGDVIDALDASLGRDLMSSGEHALPPATTDDGNAVRLEAVGRTNVVAAARATGGELGDRQWLVGHAVLVTTGLALLLAVGYEGAARRDVAEWVRLGGAPQLVSVVLFVVATVGIQVAGRRRARTGRAETFPWWLALLPAVDGALGTYSGWTMVERALAAPGVSRLVLAHDGMYEANLARFLGFALSSVACVTLASLPGLAPSASHAVAPAPRSVKRHGPAAAVVALLALAALAVSIGAPSGAFVATFAALALVPALLFPIASGGTSSRAQIERAAATLLALMLAVAVAFARVEAREAHLWSREATRADRAIEIVAAAAERQATTWLALASVMVVLGVLLAHLRSRAAARVGLERPSRRTLALASLLAVAAVVDVSLHARFRGVVAGLHEELTAQFTLFARIDPPSGDRLDATKHAPRPAVAVQVARTVVAVNGKPVAPVAALASNEGISTFATELHRALAAAAAEDRAGTAELALMIDKDVAWGTVQDLLELARASGVHEVEILLTRGRPFIAPPGGPPSLGLVLPSDFVVVRASLADVGLGVARVTRFGDVAPALVDAALADERAVPLLAPQRIVRP